MQLTETFSWRTRNIVRHIGWSFLFKAGAIIANFMIVPLAISYLGTESYGVWLTISSVLTWLMLFDIGLGNGLRNKFAEARAAGDDSKAHAYVSTAYYAIACISGMIALLLLLCNIFVDWGAVFNASPLVADKLSRLMPLIFAFFGVQLVAKLIISMYQGDQHHSIQDKVNFSVQMLALVALYGLLQTDTDSIVLFGSIYTALPVLVLVSVNVLAFRSRFFKYRPRLELCSKTNFMDVANLGFRFFIIQVSAVVLFSTDNFIIAHLFGPNEVVPYNVALKYFSIVLISYSILIGPFWSAFTEAYSRRDLEWIRNSVNGLQKLWLIAPPMAVVMLALSDRVYSLWVGPLHVPFTLSAGMAVFVVVNTFNMIYVAFLNGTGLISVQLVVSIFVLVLNIPLSLFLAGPLGLGSIGVILGTVLCLATATVVWMLQYRKVMNGTAIGVWAR